MKRTTLFGLVALLLVGVVTAGTASAFGWGFHQRNSEEREAIHEALENKDFDAWKEIMENRLTEENFNKRVERFNQMSEKREKMNAVKQAIEAGDYNAWLEAIENLEGHPQQIDPLSEEDFNTLIEIHQAKQDGDFDKVSELREDLGFEPGQGPRMGFGHGRGFKSGFGFGR